MKGKPIDNNSQTVWERIVNESVASTLKRIGASIVNEMALPLKTFGSVTKKCAKGFVIGDIG